MLNIWLFVGVFTFIVITYMGFTDSFKVWGYYYWFSAATFVMYFLRKYMIKRMEKHLKFLEEKAKEEA